MCHLVTIGTRDDRSSIDALMGVDFPLAMRPSTNPSVRSLFPKTDRLFEVTHGGCSCDVVASRQEPDSEGRRARLRAGYERKGWSDAKIARALAESDSRHHRRVSQRHDPGAHFIRLVHTLAGRPGGVRVLIHFYSGRFDSEEIAVVGTARMPVDRIVTVGDIAEDRPTDIIGSS
jgi:hypothetical protein